MRIAIVGAGGQGGLFGGFLSLAGEDVTFIERGDHLEAIQRRGLTLKSDRGTIIKLSVRATDDPEEIGPVDLVLFCVKTYDLDEAAADARPLVGRNTVVLPLQNGIDAPERLGRTLGRESVIGGVSYASGKIESPGIISYGGFSGKLIFGELYGGASQRTERILSAFQRADVKAELHLDIRAALWEKFVLVCATGGVMALLRLPLGPILDSPESTALCRGVMEEVEAVARACNVRVAEGVVQRHFDFLKTDVSPSGRSSQLDDLLAGRRLELESLNGTVVRLGRELDIPTPLNFSIYAALLPYVNGPPPSPE